MISRAWNNRHRLVAFVLIVLLLVPLALCASSCGDNSFSSETQDKLAETVGKVMKEYKIPGVIVGIWQKGKGQYTEAFGKAKLAGNNPMRVEHLFRIASITKTFTANAVLQLVDEKKLSLDDKVSKFDWSTGLPNADQITIRMLLNHTSGYPDLENDTPEFMQIRFGDPTKVWTHEEILDWGRKMNPLFPPGTGYHYTNFGYYLLGMMIESVTGRTAEQEIERLCADKLGLGNTRLANMPAYLVSKPHSNGYAMRDQVPPEVTIPGKTNIVDTVRWNTTASWTAGGVVSDLNNMKVWIESVASGSLLSPEMREAQIKDAVPITDSANGPSYGLGVNIIKMQAGEMRWHNGAVLGYSSYAGSLPDNSLTIVIFCNMMPGPNNEVMAATKLVAPLLTIIEEDQK
jgi:D-alanyl-D-alanine carboxypeptidase